jgi:hypothetical protein
MINARDANEHVATLNKEIEDAKSEAGRSRR